MSKELRLFLFLVVWLGIVFAFTLLFPPKQKKETPITTNIQTPEKTIPTYIHSEQPFTNVIATNSLRIILSDVGIREMSFQYEGREYELTRTNYAFTPLSILLTSIITPNNSLPEELTFSKEGKRRIKIEDNFLLLRRELIPVTNYVFDLIVEVKNENRRPVVFNGFSLVFSGPLGPETSDEHFAYMYLRTGYIDKSTSNLIETLTTSIFTGTERFAIRESGVVGGIWMENRYTVVGIIPVNCECRAEFVVRETRYAYNKVMSLRTSDEILDEGEEKVYRFRVMAGPRKNEILEAFGHGLKGLEDGGILKPVYDLLKFLVKFFYNITGSWGIAVVLIAVAIKVLLEPLSIKAAISMKRLQLIAPKVREIQEKYKGDPKRMNAEIAELYRIYGANPASGCLPLLLQIPIFIALYNVLSGFIELKHQGLLWIKDLTKPDTVLYIKELEGLIILPASINLLPIIMTGVSLLQTYIASSKTQTQQSFVMWLLPIIFMFIFWNLPSALVLYWTIQTILSAIEQYVINKVVK